MHKLYEPIHWNLGEYQLSKQFFVALTLLSLSLAFHARPVGASALSQKSDADYVVQGAGSKSHSLGAWCKKHDSVKIWVEGSSTAYFSALKCKTVTIHVEGASTLCMTGSFIGLLQGVLEGSSTVNVTNGLIRQHTLKPTGNSKFQSYAAGKVPCGLLGHK